MISEGKDEQSQGQASFPIVGCFYFFILSFNQNSPSEISAEGSSSPMPKSSTNSKESTLSKLVSFLFCPFLSFLTHLYQNLSPITVFLPITIDSQGTFKISKKQLNNSGVKILPSSFSLEFTEEEIDSSSIFF